QLHVANGTPLPGAVPDDVRVHWAKNLDVGGCWLLAAVKRPRPFLVVVVDRVPEANERPHGDKDDNEAKPRLNDLEDLPELPPDSHGLAPLQWPQTRRLAEPLRIHRAPGVRARLAARRRSIRTLIVTVGCRTASLPSAGRMADHKERFKSENVETA